MQALSPELSKTVEELKAQADKMKAELEDKAAQAGTTVEDQIKEIKNAAENAENLKMQSQLRRLQKLYLKQKKHLQI